VGRRETNAGLGKRRGRSVSKNAGLEDEERGERQER
jgi:hypothetical protein